MFRKAVSTPYPHQRALVGTGLASWVFATEHCLPTPIAWAWTWTYPKKREKKKPRGPHREYGAASDLKVLKRQPPSKLTSNRVPHSSEQNRPSSTSSPHSKERDGPVIHAPRNSIHSSQTPTTDNTLHRYFKPMNHSTPDSTSA